MACVALHSHLLYGLLVVYMMIVVSLLCSESYVLYTKPSTKGGGSANGGSLNVEGFKVSLYMFFR
ncbi:hypothetical protein OESDEN_08837 [Oesophagostomum dentatum]|uniref:Transmembrane protein n=1 Tax=Oesophagostomum dentatum TaxID=61180 RepID=A0A0B1T7D3_OESDE|nr:hypothetical protein OESDEN_08837 [Oesophagostomum dentatum]